MGRFHPSYQPQQRLEPLNPEREKSAMRGRCGWRFCTGWSGWSGSGFGWLGMGSSPILHRCSANSALLPISPSRLKIKAQLYEPMSTQPNCQTASPTLYCTLQCPSLTGIAEISLIRAYLLLSELLQWVSDTYYVVNYSWCHYSGLWTA